MEIRLWRLSVRENMNLYLFVAVLFVVGAVFGALLVNALTFEQQQELSDLLGTYVAGIKQPDELNRAAAFRETIFFYGKWLGLIWLLGLSVIGLPAVFALDFLKGILVGFSIGLLVREWAWQGVVVSLAAVGPQNALVVPAFLIASVAAARFAYFVVRERLFRRKGQLLPPFLAFSGVAGLMLFMLACAALYEAYAAPLLLARLVPALTGG